MLGENYKERLIIRDKAKENEAGALSLFISHNSLIYSVSDKNFKNISQLGHVELLNTSVGSQSFTERIAFLLNNYQLPQKKFGKVTISVLSKDFTIVPEAFSSSGHVKEFLAFSSGLTEVKNPNIHSIKNVKFCYVFEQELIQY